MSIKYFPFWWDHISRHDLIFLLQALGTGQCCRFIYVELNFFVSDVQKLKLIFYMICPIFCSFQKQKNKSFQTKLFERVSCPVSSRPRRVYSVSCKLKFNSLTSASLWKTIKRVRVNLLVSPAASVIRLVKDNQQNEPLLNLVLNPFCFAVWWGKVRRI